MVSSLAHRVEQVKLAEKGLLCPRYEYDIFISYRKDSERGTAARLHEALTQSGLRVFWDERELEAGYGWLPGFLSGLRSSRLFVPLISSGGLAKMSDRSEDHSEDFFLLELETAVDIASVTAVETESVTGQTSFICPVWIGQQDGSGYPLDDYDDRLRSK